MLRDLPIPRKLSAITIVAAGAALVMASGSFAAYDLIAFRGDTVRQVWTEAEIIARQSSASLVFKDPEAAGTTLEPLAAEPHVVSAAIYTPDGALFASYVRKGTVGPPPRPAPGQRAGDLFQSDRLVLWRAVEFDHGIVGTVLIESDLTAVTARLERYALIALGVLLVSFLAAHWVASRLHRSITGPVQHLAATADDVSTRRDYSVRAVVQGRDELGHLTLAFNHMLDEIEERDAALHASEEKYKILFDANPNPMCVYDPRTLAFLAVNQAVVRVYGYSRDEFLAMTIKEIRPPEEVPVLLEQLKGPLEDVSRSDGLWRHRKKDGSTLDMEIVASTILFGGVPARLVLATDVSEREN